MTCVSMEKYNIKVLLALWERRQEDSIVSVIVIYKTTVILMNPTGKYLLWSQTSHMLTFFFFF